MEPRRNADPGRVRRKRIEAGLQQQELARRAGISKPHMSSIEHGRVNPSPGVLQRLATALGCEIPDLMPPEPVSA
ncbi:helix-turn-helix domain-containing protein [Streptomyces scabiei]|uniref:helix-turn-helix domain-containing protein n=1 Tax=Streptomyces scabiei TaxID=1930 RepID=UPI00099EF0CB|nr:helix-turn-helix transcriptional regulator [Streptomyces scabiei]